MNLVNGKILDTKDCDKVLENLDERIRNTLSKGSLNPQTVVAACDRLVHTLDASLYLRAMAGLGIPEPLAKSYLQEARQMFSEKALNHRLQVELGDGWLSPKTYIPPYSQQAVREQMKPLGVLLHIGAGNADGLPAFSVIEGLLTGNINILKLPANEGGISVRLLWDLINIEPSLAEYIYVFDYASRDNLHIEKLVNVADGVIVWGGEEAVSAFRKMTKPNIKLIEWGHKISFAYVTEQGITEDGLRGIAKNIAQTGQLLCSSCQGVFLDTDTMDSVYAFCERFLPILDEAMHESAKEDGGGMQWQVALEVCTAELETIYTNNKIFRGNNCSLTACVDKALEPAIRFGNAWVKPLPHEDLLAVLRPYKNYLQTVGLLCTDLERDTIRDTLFKTGVVRICPGERMSMTYCAAAHDGEYPLRRYTKIVVAEDL